ncbi:trypco2 family protein [uncultured Thiothrix sp.]|uniref:trypco2 family protein n=1 Tax=uncultured Thiothrix sp. TaxID=223185 RepID=UPI002616040D|nr:trypco2 family protein [uncultured Thiothrix sp.]HMT93781.1 hypothetical protein [Thiolinea sp.]
MTQKLELAAVIKALREELQSVQIAGKGQDIRFQTNSIEVEFQTMVDYELGAEGSGKIKFWVLDIDVKGTGKYKRSQTHKIKLSLTPKKQKSDGSHEDLMLSDDE